MANRYWDGGTSTDPTNVNNWSDTDGGGTPASSVPGVADIAHFTANGDGNACTMTDAWTLGELSIVAGYTSKFDTAGYALNTSTASGGTGDFTAAGGGEFDCDSSTITCSGDFDNKDQTTWTRGT